MRVQLTGILVLPHLLSQVRVNVTELVADELGQGGFFAGCFNCLRSLCGLTSFMLKRIGNCCGWSSAIIRDPCLVLVRQAAIRELCSRRFHEVAGWQTLTTLSLSILRARQESLPLVYVALDHGK